MTQYFPPPPAPGKPCPTCATPMQPAQREITEKRRIKFGVFWVLLTLLFGLGLILWLMMPRKKVVTGVDRFYRCPVCQTEAPA